MSRRLASTISFFAWRASRSPFRTMCTILRNSRILETVLGGERVDLRSQILDTVLVLGGEILPTLLGQLRYTVKPSWIEL